MLDTACAQGNWISRALLKKLGMTHEIRPVKHAPKIKDIHRRSVKAIGEIDFQWQSLNGIKIYDPVSFYVQDISDEVEMLFGAPYIKAERLLIPNPALMLILTSHETKTSCKPYYWSLHEYCAYHRR